MEILDRGEETPRSPFHSAAADGTAETLTPGDGGQPSSCKPVSAIARKRSQVICEIPLYTSTAFSSGGLSESGNMWHCLCRRL